ncbi:hypothetical protein BM221_007085 [Beauveria bassiana]|uniref:Uncharacterized protein n=1 Tax=Beauveria bassiana TaxID=176275 RepID=A0A2N6NJF6_BEABA|nr:hypothetical protein BM221_007085 [Beauveria bassiana]
MALGLEIGLDGTLGLGAQGATAAGNLKECEGQLHEEFWVLPDSGLDRHGFDSDGFLICVKGCVDRKGETR